ncbi:gametocyte-specific factor 1 homolog isoform X1 [Drosophila novamexicana]|uniref:gametocyte-specific factor 1 homolog isoform X1 n=1 Tax=Drosophila novamexicana TaxID=47314 RepID=UPI0011E5AAA1|nr:gametocyte-specific factor 1 homolog isoform X1 [Drosophila novamexicana]
MASTSKFDDFVSCPYNKAHIVLRGRLTKHLVRCSRNPENLNKLLVCPFNESHRLDAQQLQVGKMFDLLRLIGIHFEFMQAHIKICPERAGFERHAQKDEQPPLAEPVSQVSIECEEDWDNEPDAPTYDPSAYCEENLVIRSSGLHGQSKSVRRDFRAKERRRFAEKQ